MNRSRHNQSYKPVLEQTEAVGHAVNCVTLMVSMLDVGVLTGITAYATAARRMWEDIVIRKMYVTGGVGSTGNEGFGEPYVLPNISAYAETCAVLMFATLNHRLFLLTGDSQYIDVLERGIYNNALSGVSPSGDRFFYVNRLASAGDGRDTRWERASLECCPPNLVRFLASMPGYIYAQDGRGAIYVNLYVSSEATIQHREQDARTAGRERDAVERQDGDPRVRQRAGPRCGEAPYPRLGAEPRRAGRPVLVRGRSVAGAPPSRSTAAASARRPDAKGYVSLDREWRSGDRIELEFPFEVRKVIADDRVRETRGRVAIERGPIVYCVEEPASPCRVDAARARRAADFAPSALRRGRLGNDHGRSEEHVESLRSESAHHADSVLHVGEPRPAEMSVWIPTREYVPGDIGPAGGLIFYVNANYATDGWRYLEAAPFDQSLGAKWGCFRGRSRARGGPRSARAGRTRATCSPHARSAAWPLTSAPHTF